MADSDPWVRGNSRGRARWLVSVSGRGSVARFREGDLGGIAVIAGDWAVGDGGGDAGPELGGAVVGVVEGELHSPGWRTMKNSPT